MLGVSSSNSIHPLNIASNGNGISTPPATTHNNPNIEDANSHKSIVSPLSSAAVLPIDNVKESNSKEDSVIYTFGSPSKNNASVAVSTSSATKSPPRRRNTVSNIHILWDSYIYIYIFSFIYDRTPLRS